MAFDPLSISAGELRHSITIQAQDTSAPDAYGQTTQQWTTVLTTRAKIEDTSSASYRDTFAQNALVAQSTDLITIRWPGSSITIEPGQRVLYGDDVFLIQAIDNVLRRNRKLRLACMIIDESSN